MSAAPPRLRQVGYWYRTRVESRTDLLPSDKLVARAIGYARCGKYTHAISRVRIALRTGLSIRTVCRAIGRLVAAGVLFIEERGRIEGGRRYQQVYRLLSPQVTPRDTASLLRGDRTRRRTRRATHGQQMTLLLDLPDRTTAPPSDPTGGRPPSTDRLARR